MAVVSFTLVQPIQAALDSEELSVGTLKCVHGSVGGRGEDGKATERCEWRGTRTGELCSGT
jgi:hypothetical protein